MISLKEKQWQAALMQTKKAKQPQTNTEGTMESNTKSAFAENHLFEISDNTVQKR